METKEKSKKGKAIIGIALAAIMLASVMVAMVPTGMTRETGFPKHVDSGDTIFIGEQGLGFNLTGTLGYNDTVTLYAVDPDIPDTLSLSPSYTVPSVEVGKYFYDIPTGPAGWDTNDTYINVQKAAITGDIILNTATQDSIVGKPVPKNTEIVFKVGPNFGAGKIPGALFKIEVKTPAGAIIETIDGQNLTKLEAENGTTLFVGDDSAPNGINTTGPIYADAINLTNLSTGTYKVTMKTETVECNMLSISSTEMEFTIRSDKLTIEAEKDEVGSGDDIVLTISGKPSTWYYFAIANVLTGQEPKVEDTKNVIPVIGESADANKPCAAWVKTAAGGTGDIIVSTTGADDRTYIMHVYHGFAGPTWTGPNTSISYTPAAAKLAIPTQEDEVKVKVREAKVTFDIPTTAIIGDDVTIKGTITAGEEVDILVEDGTLDGDRWDDVSVDENNEFEVTWYTERKMTGTYSIDAYIDCDLNADPAPTTVPTGFAARDEDGKTTIRLIEPGLTAEQLRNVVAEGDDYTIEGTATGVDTVDIVLVGPTGYMGGGYEKSVINGLLITSTSVTDNEFSEDIRMVDGLDTGQWMAAVFSPGRDGYYGSENITAGNLADADLSLEGKTRDQLIAILTDYTMEQAGSDDALVVFTFKVESGYIDLNPVETVAIGEPLNLTGVTNREPETLITISTFAKPAGATDLPAVLAEVEWSTKDEGVFSGTIDTTDAVPGTYTLEADDGDGNTDTITVELVEEIVPIATPTAAPTAEPTEAPAVPTPEPTAEPTPTPEPPGFEAVFAIAGLLSIAYLLVLRKRK